ncbi:hypothetical protein G6F56_007154 [Rhizopus delemar]|uniref:Uncharacterized protein n=1 Tax=Rhizopus stolonifer TaxID=4846 RepID=A0A367J7S7_RHIST|nr:hypothetical protein G6F56_007154 [Rhizopus delemar]RCH85791.1 hypothetical protein CU098_003293 [Rhizopus stolonifer]
MESTQRWRAPERKVDKELQRIKSLAVVSVLNKAFGDNEPVSSRSRSSSQVETIRRPTSEYEEEELNKIPIDTEMKGKYETTQKELEQAKEQVAEAQEQNSQQQHLLLLQDALVGALSQQIEFLLTENKKLLAQREAQVSIEEIQKTLEDLEREDWKEELESVRERLVAGEEAVEAIERTSQSLQKDTRSQGQSIEAKMETLMSQLKEKNDVVDRLHYEQHIKQMFHTTESQTSSRRSSNARPKSLVARYKGALPAASPPPSAPLPPIPAEPIRSSRPTSAYNSDRPISSCDQDLISRPLSIYNQEAMYQHGPDYHETAHSRPVSSFHHEPVSRPISAYNHEPVSRPISAYDQEPLSRPVSTYEEEISEMVYYKEFTEQLQERLSMSKEIDELSVWKPSDYDEIQKKIHSKDWLEEDQKSAFWKGMKKKLRV